MKIGDLIDQLFDPYKNDPDYFVKLKERVEKEGDSYAKGVLDTFEWTKKTDYQTLSKWELETTLFKELKNDDDINKHFPVHDFFKNNFPDVVNSPTILYSDWYKGWKDTMTKLWPKIQDRTQIDR